MILICDIAAVINERKFNFIGNQNLTVIVDVHCYYSITSSTFIVKRLSNLIK